VAKTDYVLISNTNAVMLYCPDQRFIGIVLQTSFYILTVSVEDLCDGHADFQISKIVTCFWRILYLKYPLLAVIF
jgi:hypothetical protein